MIHYQNVTKETMIIPLPDYFDSLNIF